MRISLNPLCSESSAEDPTDFYKPVGCLLIQLFIFQPLSCVEKSLQPWAYLILALLWIMRPVPWEGGALQVWHHRQVPSVVADDDGGVVMRTIWIGWIILVSILSDDVISGSFIWKVEFPLSMRGPDPQAGS